MSEGSATSNRRMPASGGGPPWSLSSHWIEAHQVLVDRELRRLGGTTRYLLGSAILEAIGRPWRIGALALRIRRLRGRAKAGAPQLRVPPRLPDGPGVNDRLDEDELRRAREQVRSSMIRLEAIQGSRANQLGEWLARVLLDLHPLPAFPKTVVQQAWRQLRNPRPVPPPLPEIVTRYPFGSVQASSSSSDWAIEGPDWFVDMAEREPGCRRLASDSLSPRAVLTVLPPAGEIPRERIDRVLEQKRSGCQVAVWALGARDGEPEPAVAELLSAADVVVADDHAGVAALGRRLDRPVELMAPAVQPLLHNPIGWWSQGAGPAPAWESSNGPPSSWQALFSAARGRVLDSEERASCALVLGRELAALDVAPTSHAARKQRFIVLRDVIQQASIARRLERLGELIGLSCARALPGLASIVVSTNRPTHLANAVDSFARQSYRNKELVLVLHGDAFSDAQVESLSSDGGERIRVLRAPASWPLGRCLQHGVEHSEGCFVLKMDDDDWYGRRYVEDMLMALQFSCAGLVCKGCFISKIEGVKELQLFREEQEFEYGWFSGGATMVMRRALLEQVPFAPLYRAEDRVLFRDAIGLSIPVLAADRFNHVYQRRAPDRHTWKVSLSALLESHGARALAAEVTERSLDI